MQTQQQPEQPKVTVTWMEQHKTGVPPPAVSIRYGEVCAAGQLKSFYLVRQHED